MLYLKRENKQKEAGFGPFLKWKMEKSSTSIGNEINTRSLEGLTITITLQGKHYSKNISKQVIEWNPT